jgi:hypothetical protein
MILSALMEARIRTTSSTPGLAIFDTCSNYFVEGKPKRMDRIEGT